MRYRKHASWLLLPEDQPRRLRPLSMAAPQQALLMAGGVAASAGILDSYATSATIATSTRKLFSTATSCVQVKRSSDNATQDIGFSSGVIDTASLASFIGANSASVPIAYNQVDAANPLIPAITDPVSIVSTGTYLGGLLCSTGNRALKSTNNSSAFNKATIFIRGVINNTGIGTVYAMFSQGPAFAGNPNIVGQVNNDFNGYMEYEVVGAGGAVGKRVALPSSGATVLFTMTLDLTAVPKCRIWKNGVESTTAFGSNFTQTAMSAEKWYFGCAFAFNKFTDWKFTDLVVYESLLSDSDIADVNTILL